MNRPVLSAGRGDISPRDPFRAVENVTAEEKIKRFVELGISRCGSAAALARYLNVKPATVSQWRAGRKRPNAVKLIRIQELARNFGINTTEKRTQHLSAGPIQAYLVSPVIGARTKRKQH